MSEAGVQPSDNLLHARFFYSPLSGSMRELLQFAQKMKLLKHLSLTLLLGAAVATSMTTAAQNTPWDGKTYK
jgi:hypothetical protein